MARSNTGQDTNPDIDGNSGDSGTTGDNNGRIEAPKDESGLIDPASLLSELKSEQSGTEQFVRDESGNIKRNKDGSPRKKRGPKSGGATASKSAQGNSTLISGIETLAQSLMVVHTGIAIATKYDGFALSEMEANTLSKSVVNVMEQFDIVPDPRFVAVTGLVTTAGMIYGPRIYNYAEWKNEKRKRKSEEQTAQQFVSGSLTPSFIVPETGHGHNPIN